MTSQDLLPLLTDSPYWASLTSTGWGAFLTLIARRWWKVRQLRRTVHFPTSSQESLMSPLVRELGATLLADPEIQQLVRTLVKRLIVSGVQSALTNLDKDGDGTPDLLQRARAVGAMIPPPASYSVSQEGNPG